MPQRIVSYQQATVTSPGYWNLINKKFKCPPRGNLRWFLIAPQRIYEQDVIVRFHRILPELS